ncbi:APH domain-containing protein [Mycena venus]|uniref:APH domain-containing protein n=1 Tax=Mycena venus TaxID=2733690 RepID=A0A8H6XYH7_9AGAR|nr:APH domain-containing protein [Mycena venus]
MLEVVFYAGSPLPQYIRDLYIIDGQGREFDPKWVNDKLPLVILSSITCISSLSLEQVDFSGLSGATLAALGGVTARVTRVELTYVRFKDLADCLAFLGAAVTLRSLTSCITSFKDEVWSPRPVVTTILPELVELELESDDDPLLDLLCSTSSPPCIRAFSLYLGSNNISAVASFLGHLGPSLTHLHIQSFSSDRTPSDMNVQGTDLSKNPNLKKIIFGPNSSQWIVKILVTATPTLELVYMQLSPDYSDFPSLRRIFMTEGIFAV